MKPAADMPTSVSCLSTFLLPRVLCAFIFLFPASLRAQEDFTGHWEGSFIQARNEIDVKVDLRREGNVWRGTIDYPDLKPGMELKDVVVDGLHITFGLTASAGALQVRFDGLLHPKQGNISGEVFISNNQYSLSLARSDSKSQISSKESASPSAQLTFPAASISAAPKETGGGLKQASLVLAGAPSKRGGEEEPSDTGEGKNPSVPRQRFFALLFATNEYEQGWGKLNNPIGDAKSIAKVLSDVYGFVETPVFENPTEAFIKSKLKSYAVRSYGDEDEILIFFAGHGAYDDYDNAGYLITANAPKVADSRPYQINMSQLAEWVNNIKCKHILLVLDACQAGSIFFRKFRQAGEQESADLNLIKKRMVFKTRKCITSGGLQFVEDGRPGAHSPFASSFLAALSKFSSKQKVLNFADIQKEIERQMSQIKATPEFGSIGDDEPGSDFFFIVSDEGSASAKPR